MKILKYGGIVTLICGGALLGGALLADEYTNDASPRALTMIVCLWAALVIAGVLATYFGVTGDKAQKQATKAERRAKDAEAILADYEALDDFIIRIYMVCFSASQGIGHYYKWKDEFLAVNFGRDNVLKCLREGLVPPVPDASALDDEQLATLTKIAERSHFAR